MHWIESTIVNDDERRVLVATAGPYVLTVVERQDGSAYWSCGEGGAELLGERAGEASTIQEGMRAAIADARWRWSAVGEALDALEVK